MPTAPANSPPHEFLQRIEITNPLDLAFWACLLSADEASITAAVKEVGNDLHTVDRELRRRSSARAAGSAN